MANVLMIGTGEYTTGYVDGKPSNSDKSAGVVALTMFDLKQKKKVNNISLCGVNGTKFTGIRTHLDTVINNVYHNSHYNLEMSTYPADDEIKPTAYLDAINNCNRGDCVTIFTPDNTHFDIALACIRRGLHVIVTKPMVQTLEQHILLHKAAIEYNVLVCIEVHKRWDPIYSDARDRIQNLGSFSYMYSYMSQPKHQLDTFRAWAGKSSDISYYLNSHHIDYNEWCIGSRSKPVKVTAIASTGVATNVFNMSNCEDTITLTVQWLNVVDNTLASAIYTSSWIAPKSDVHSQQRFFYMGALGEVSIDQAHRGYNMSDDITGYKSINPLFMKYVPTDGKFTGQLGYGYRSFECFIDAVNSINSGNSSVNDYNEYSTLATIGTTYMTTAILEAGRRSLDSNNASITIHYEDVSNQLLPTSMS